METYKNLIIGAGLTGLSAAHHFEKNRTNYLIIESNNQAGGLARSIREQGFTFDLAIHMLHLRSEKVKNLIMNLLDNELIIKNRKAGVLINNTIIPYPFQYNLFFLDEKIKKECLKSVVEVGGLKNEKNSKLNFFDWIIKTQGEGIGKHFMIPYNEKCYGVNLKELNTDWLGRYVPKPDIIRIIEGSKKDLSHKFKGYNQKFYYTKKGGIDIVPRAFEKKLTSLRYEEKIIAIDLDKKVVHTEKSKFNFSNLISTIPLDKLIDLIIDAPQSIMNSRKLLKCNSVSTVLLGIDRPSISNLQWMYIPNKNILPYRISFPMNYSMNMVPPNTSSICAEFSYFGERTIDDKKLIQNVKTDLKSLNIIKNNDRIIYENVVDLKNGYVIFDKNRNKSLSTIKEFLLENSVYTAGRFANWEYSSMEDAIIQGMEVSSLVSSKNLIDEKKNNY